MNDLEKIIYLRAGRLAERKRQLRDNIKNIEMEQSMLRMLESTMNKGGH